MYQYRSTLEERNKAHHDIKRLFREKGHLAKGAVKLSEQVDVVIRQVGDEISLRKTTPKILSFKDFRGEMPRTHLDLAGWSINASFNAIARRTIPKGIPVKPSVCVHLNIKGTNITDKSLTALKHMPNIEYLNVSKCHALSDAGLMHVRQYLPQLKVLSISYCKRLTAVAITATWEGCQRIDTLYASHLPGLTDKVLHVIANTKRRGDMVKYIDVSHCRSITTAGILSIADSPNAKLDTFLFNTCAEIDSMAFFAFGGSTSLAKLKHLDVSKLKMEGSGISWLVDGGQALETLNISECRGIDDLCLEMLSRCPKLRELNVSECQAITNRGVELLLGTTDDDEKPFTKLYFKSCMFLGDAALTLIGSKCPDLSLLDLRGLPRVTDEGIIRIAKGCLKLRELRVSGCGSMNFYGQPIVTDASLVVLGKLCRGLEKIDTAGCVGVSDEGVVKLAKYCPNLLAVNFSSTNVGDVAIAALAVHCTNLKSIIVSQAKKITNEAVEAIALGLPQLKNLNVQYCNINNAALQYLAENYIELERLCLNGNDRITDEGIHLLCDGCSTLKELTLKDCPILTRTEVSKAAEKLKLGHMAEHGNMAVESKPEHWNNFVAFLLLHYRACLTLQSRFRRWQKKQVTLSSLTRRKLRREIAAARTIQKCARQYLSWKAHLKILSLGRNVHLITLVQATYRGNTSRRSSRLVIFIKLRAIKCIQRHYRFHYAYLIRNANTIQRVYRGHLGRKIAQELRMVVQHNAVNAIIAWYGKCMQRFRMAARARHLIACVRKLQRQARCFLANIRFKLSMRVYREMITRIQAMIRMFLAIRYVENRRCSMHAAGLTIQRVYRGHRDRCYVKRYRVVANEATTKIQSSFRAYRGQKMYHRKRYLIRFVQRRTKSRWMRRRFCLLAAQAKDLQLFLAAQCIQRHWRGVRGRRRGVLFRKIRNAVYYEKGQNVMQFLLRKRILKKGAAIVLQRYVARWKARRVRQGILRFRRFHSTLCIQRNVKGWYERIITARMRQAMEEASLDIQRVYRGHRGRKIYRSAFHERLRQISAVVIQKYIRGFLARCFYYYKREAYIWAAGMVQRVFRGCRGRYIFALKRALEKLRKKDEYMNSVKGRYESKRDGLQERYDRQRLDRHVKIVKALKEEWERRTNTLTESVRPLKRKYKATWKKTDESVSENLRSYRKLIGVTENVYVGKNEFKDETIRHGELTQELKTLQQGIMEFKYLLRKAISEKRVIEPTEFWECAEKAKVFNQIA